MLKPTLTNLLFIVVFLIATSSTAFASEQCIKNNSGAILNVTWHNHKGKVDDNASNSNLTVGYEACQDNTNLGFAVVTCSGCIFAQIAAQTAVAAGGAGAYGVCMAATAGGVLHGRRSL
jgi:hypothetical protein